MKTAQISDEPSARPLLPSITAIVLRVGALGNRTAVTLLQFETTAEQLITPRRAGSYY